MAKRGRPRYKDEPCHKCGGKREKNKDGRWVCGTCLKERRNAYARYNKLRYDRLKADGLCFVCCKPTEGNGRCPKCNAKNNKARRKTLGAAE